MKTLIAGLALLLSLLTTAAVAQDGPDTERYGEQKVVYHINGNGGEGDAAYLGALRNVQNHINAVGAENLTLAIVMHGNGVNMLARALENQQLEGAIVNLKQQGVSFLVCNNTLVGRDLDYETDLFDVYEEDIVPPGVAELARLQLMGYAYIKP